MDLLLRAVAADDAELAAIAVAALDREEVISERAVHTELDALASSLAPALAGREGAARVRTFVRAFHRQLGFFAPEDYADPRLHRVDEVIERRAGSPAALAVALLALGRRLDVALEPIAFPGHFLVRTIGLGAMLIEPCTGAMPIPEEALVRLTVRELELSRSNVDALLSRASARAVALRLLENLERAYRERGERGRALSAGERIQALGGTTLGAQQAALSLFSTLVRAEHRATVTAKRLTVHREGLSFRIDGGPAVDLRRRRALPLILVRLAQHHRSGAKHGLGWPALVEAGWPGERIQAEAAWSRLRTAVRTLRKLGLEGVLITIGTGYLLDPSCRVEWA